MNRTVWLCILTLLCVLLLAEGIAPVMAMQAGKSPVYQFNVTILGNAAGKITINTADQYFVYNMHSLNPGIKYTLDSSCGRIVEPVCTNPGGALHVEGVWDTTCDLESATFELRSLPGSHCS